MKRILFAVVALVLSAAAQAAEPMRFEPLGGSCKLSAVGDGVWWNSNYPHDLDLTTGCFQIGVSQILHRSGTWAYGARLAYVDFGTIRANAAYPMHDSEQFTTKPNGHDCDRVTLTGCVGYGRAEQQARGMSLGATVEHALGPVALEAEAGLYVYYASFHVDIESYPKPGAFAPMSMTWEGWQATPYLGAGARYEYLFVQARVYASMKAAEHGCGGCSGITNGPATQVLIGVSIPL